MDKQVLENRILEIIRARGDEGIVQSELWSILRINGREGSGVVAKLARAGLIRKEPIVFKGKRTYRLIAVDRKYDGVKMAVKLNPIVQVPCFLCRDLDRCGPGGYFNPLSCSMLTRFLRE